MQKPPLQKYVLPVSRVNPRLARLAGLRESALGFGKTWHLAVNPFGLLEPQRLSALHELVASSPSDTFVSETGPFNVFKTVFSMARR